MLRRDLGDETVESWRVSINFDALVAVDTPDGKRIDTQRGAPLAGHHVDLPIPGRNIPLRLNLDTVYEGYAGVITYAGIIDGDDGSLVAISVDGDDILGKIHHWEGFTYLIENVPGRSEYTLSVIDQTLMPQADHDHDRAPVDEAIGGVGRTGTPEADRQDIHPRASSGNVRLLVVYTPAVGAETNVVLMANNIVSGFNQSLSLSGVDGGNFVTLAEVRPLESDLDVVGRRCRNNILANMSDKAHEFTLLDDWMEVAYADIGLVVMTAEPGYIDCHALGRIGGAGIRISSSEYPDHSDPFANTTDTYALADLTAIHEIGHVLNGRHEDCQATIPSYACGYAPSHCDWQSMMGGYIQCGFDPGEPPDSQPTVRIARWSNPNISYNSEPTGTATRNMVTALDINMPHAASWKGVQDPPPPAPDPVSVTPLFCWGLNVVQWAAQAEAVEYRLFRSYSPAFSSPFPVYSGPGTFASIDVDTTWYLRVQACNSGGCVYSSQVQAQYHPSCPSP